MATNITIPDFQWAAFYYPELLEALIQYKRLNVPELTEELPHDPLIQMIRAFALVGHLNNVNLDFTAKNCFLPTANLREAVRAQFKLIGIRLLQASPSQTDLVAKLSRTFTDTTTIVPTLSQFSIKETPVIIFEYVDVDPVIISRTDHIFKAFFAGGGTISSDYSDTYNTDSVYHEEKLGDYPDDQQNMFYIAHENILWNGLKITFDPAITKFKAVTRMVLEYYEGDWEVEHPDTVAVQGSGLRFNLDSLFGQQLSLRFWAG